MKEGRREGGRGKKEGIKKTKSIFYRLDYILPPYLRDERRKDHHPLI